MEFFSKIDAVFVKIANPILIVLGLAVAFMLAIGILFRAMFGDPVFGMEEIMLICVMWFYMLGATMASRERSHLSADFVRVFTNNHKIWRAASIFSTLVSFVVAIMFATWAYDLFAWGVEKGQTTPVFHIPWAVSQSSLFFAAVCFVCYLVRDLKHEFSGKYEEELQKELKEKEEDPFSAVGLD